MLPESVPRLNEVYVSVANGSRQAESHEYDRCGRRGGGRGKDEGSGGEEDGASGGDEGRFKGDWEGEMGRDGETRRAGRGRESVGG